MSRLDAIHQPSAERQIQNGIDDVERVAVEPPVGERHQQANAVAVEEIEKDVQQHAEIREQQERHDLDAIGRSFPEHAIDQQHDAGERDREVPPCASTPCVQPRRNDIASVSVANTATSTSGKLLAMMSVLMPSGVRLASPAPPSAAPSRE